MTTERRRGKSATAAAARSAYCQAALERERERDGDADDGADRGGTGTVEEGAGAVVVAETVEVRRAEEHERERGCEGDERGEQAAGDAGRGVADDGHGVHDRAGRDLAERDGVEELRVGHPVVVVDGVALHERDDDEPAAVGERPDLERHPHQREHAAAGGRRGRGEEAARGGCRACRCARSVAMATSIRPHASSTRTSHGPTVAAAVAPSSA